MYSGHAAGSLGKRRLRFGRADKPDRKADHRRGTLRALGIEHVEQVKQRGRRVADHDEGAGQPVPPQLERSRRARVPSFAASAGTS